jgi:23S rRNA pseudouridine2605 synthase
VSRERVQKLLARAGYGSRRACEDYIREGRVAVNGETVRLGATADPDLDDIRVDGALLPQASGSVYLILNKPVGVLSSGRSQGGRPTVLDLVEAPARVYPVGRLDAESEGLVLLTNDGDLAFQLTHPRFGYEKEYRVLLDPVPDSAQLEAWRHGPVLADGARARPARVWPDKPAGRGAWVRVVLQEGRKRQIRDVAGRLGLNVRRLIRVRIDGVTLGQLKPGEWRELTRAEVERLKAGGQRQAKRRAGSGRPSTRTTSAAPDNGGTRRAER